MAHRDRFNRARSGLVSRRSLLRTSVAGAAGAAAGATLDAEQYLGRAADDPQTREFTLTASEIEWDLMPGTTVRAWGYNGHLPGPEIGRARVT